MNNLLRFPRLLSAALVLIIAVVIATGCQTKTTSSTNPTLAFKVPERSSQFFNDHAEVLSLSEHQQIVELLYENNYGTGVEVVFLTINSLEEWGATVSELKVFTEYVFDQWQVGDATYNNGILIIFAKEDRYIHIALGASYSRQYDRRSQRIVDDVFIPYFENEAYSQGLLEGHG